MIYGMTESFYGQGSLYGQYGELEGFIQAVLNPVDLHLQTYQDKVVSTDSHITLGKIVSRSSDIFITVSQAKGNSSDLHITVGKIVEGKSDIRIKVWVGPLLGGYDLSELGLILTDETIIGFAPSVKIEEVTIPGKHGAFLQGNKLGDRVFELELILDPNRDIDLNYHEKIESFLKVRDKVASIVDNIRDNSTLMFAEEPERVYTVFWKDISGIQEYIDSGLLTIPLVARPEAVSAEEHIIQVPAGIPFTLRYEGTRAIHPIITLSSQQEESLDFNNRETIIRAINRTDLTGYLNTVIDGDNFEVTSQYDQGQVPDLDRLQGPFPELVHGDNIILATTALTITYKDIWDD